MSDALLALSAELGRATSEAFAQLGLSGPGVVDAEPPARVAAALDGAELPAVLVEATFSGAAAGTAVLVLTVPGARRLAAALGAIDEEEAEFGSGDLGERELAAATGVLDAVLAEAAGTTGLRPAASTARVLVDEGAVQASGLRDGEAATVALVLLGEPARLTAVVARGALADLDQTPDVAEAVAAMPLSSALRSIDVRVWAELGRTRMPTGEVVGLPSGAIVELDHDAEDAVDLYVDGQRYATGRLVVCEDESWGVLVEQVHGLG